MKTLNYIDEQGRIKYIKFFPDEPAAQYDSHGISYLCARNIMKRSQPDLLMGLEQLMQQENDKNI